MGKIDRFGKATQAADIEGPASFTHSEGQEYVPEPVDAEQAQDERLYDPADHTVVEVNAKLRELYIEARTDDAAADEYDRILRAEREGRNRQGVVGG